MPQPYARNVRIERTVQEIIAPELIKLVENTIITVTNVFVSKDLSHAKVLYSVIGEDNTQVQEALDSKVGYLRTKLAKGMFIKKVPNIIFIPESKYYQS